MRDRKTGNGHQDPLPGAGNEDQAGHKQQVVDALPYMLNAEDGVRLRYTHRSGCGFNYKRRVGRCKADDLSRTIEPSDAHEGIFKRGGQAFYIYFRAGQAAGFTDLRSLDEGAAEIGSSGGLDDFAIIEKANVEGQARLGSFGRNFPEHVVGGFVDLLEFEVGGAGFVGVGGGPD